MAPAPGQHRRRRSDDARHLRSVVAVNEHPQLHVIETKLAPKAANGPTLREYRVYNWAKFPSGRIQRGDGSAAVWLVLSLGAALLIAKYMGWKPFPQLDKTEIRVALNGLPMALLWFQSRRILYQSITPLPGLGIQLSTTRGFSIPRPGGRSLLPVSTSRMFVPLDEISSLVVNEALSGWEMRHYLALIRRNGAGIDVVFDSLRQPGSLLIYVRERVLADLYS